MDLNAEFTGSKKVIYTAKEDQSIQLTEIYYSPDSSTILFAIHCSNEVVLKTMSRELKEKYQFTTSGSFNELTKPSFNINNNYIAYILNMRGKESYSNVVALYSLQGEKIFSNKLKFENVNLHATTLYLTNSDEIFGFSSYYRDFFKDDKGVIYFKMNTKGEIIEFNTQDLESEFNKSKNGKSDVVSLSTLKIKKTENGYLVSGESFWEHNSSPDSPNSSTYNYFKSLVIIDFNDNFERNYTAVIDKSQNTISHTSAGGSALIHTSKDNTTILYTAEGSKGHSDENGSTYIVEISNKGELNKSVLFDSKTREEQINPSRIFQLTQNKYVAVYEMQKAFKVGFLEFK